MTIIVLSLNSIGFSKLKIAGTKKLHYFAEHHLYITLSMKHPLLVLPYHHHYLLLYLLEYHG